MILAYQQWAPISLRAPTLLLLLGTFYSLLALIFALCAAIWARASRDLVLAYFRDYFGLSSEERDVFSRFASTSEGGKQHLSRTSFLQGMSSSRDAEYYLNMLIRKGWIKESGGKLIVATDKRMLAEQLKGK